MIPANDTARELEPAIMIDEVGIRYGMLGTARLKTICQPIFSVRDEHVAPVAAFASGAFQIAGRTLLPPEIEIGFSDAQRAEADGLFRRLHPQNLFNVTEAPLSLHVELNPMSQAAEDIGDFFAAANLSGIGPHDLVCDLSRVAAASADTFGAMVRLLRGHGARLSLDMAAASTVATLPSRLARPDVVRLPSAWFQLLCRDGSGAKLLQTTVEALHARGAVAHVEGIDTAWHLKIAVEAGVDLLQGELLAPRAPVGSAFDDQPRTLSSLLGEPSAILALFGR